MERVVIQASYKRREYKSCFSRKGSVYFNLKRRGEIQVSLERDECNLVKKINIFFKTEKILIA